MRRLGRASSVRRGSGLGIGGTPRVHGPRRGLVSVGSGSQPEEARLRSTIAVVLASSPESAVYSKRIARDDVAAMLIKLLSGPREQPVVVPLPAARRLPVAVEFGELDTVPHTWGQALR